MKGTTAYFNGEWIPFEDIWIDRLDRGFVTGDALFDAARTFHGVGFRLEEHIDRLYRSLAYARLDPGMPPTQMLEITEEVLRRNEPGRAKVGDWQVWQFVTRGPGRWAHDAGPPSVGVKVAPVDFGRFGHLYDTGAHAVITRVQSTHNNSLDPKLKCYSRMHYNLAELEAADVAADGWPLLTDDQGNITEGSAYHVFVVTQGVLRTLPHATPSKGFPATSPSNWPGACRSPWRRRTSSRTTCMRPTRSFSAGPVPACSQSPT